ncbi:hypothetical protein DSO57_1007588 [Entomophthora muscae]|uniref:Uncharacterized protein n=1 Tax=Entomophthora muscae TaxID=34485 RepID=A0ACC2RYE0_9FUNG|nr:hypothetical protein DSO57_1007588 [Entomophthora muscae]
MVKLGPIIWWAMPVPALTPPSPAGAPQYSWYPERTRQANMGKGRGCKDDPWAGQQRYSDPPEEHLVT